MNAENLLAAIMQQNEVIILLLARMVWTPEQLLAAVIAKKRNPDAYAKVYNALDGKKTGTQLAALAGVKQQSMSEALQSWLEEGLIANIGTEAKPLYRGFMKLPENGKAKHKKVTRKISNP